MNEAVAALDMTDPVDGVWCDLCALPSAIAVIVISPGIVSAVGPSAVFPHLSILSHCLDCDDVLMIS